MFTIHNFKRAQLVALLLAIQLAIFAPVAAFAATVGITGHPLFSVSAAGGLSNEARAQAIQRNLDNAIVAVQGHSANVNIVTVNGAPVITLGGYHVITVDSNTAKTMHTTPQALANMWAQNLRTAMLDSAAVSRHIATINGANTFAAVVEPETNFVQLPVGLQLPIRLVTPISRNTALGSTVQARLSRSVTLPGGQVLPAGTLVVGHAIPVSSSSPFFGGAGSVQIAFDQLQLSNGTMIPISASIVGGVQPAQQTSMLGNLRSTTLGRVVTNGAIGAGLGALVGTGIGAIVAGASRHVRAGKGIGTGAWMGAAIGGGMGALSGLFLKPNTSLTFPAGQELVLELNAPAQVAVQGGAL